MTLIDFIPALTKINIGWTLLHSLWEGALIYVLLKTLLRFVPSQKAMQRYGLSCIALSLLLMSCASTFLYLITTSINATQLLDARTVNTNLSLIISRLTFNQSFANTWVQIINSQMPWIIQVWIIGIVFFFIRFFGGLYYIHFLMSRVIAVSTHWKIKLNDLSKRVEINRLVRIAESVHVNKPMVLGYVKPIILLPLGLLSGLPPAQVEAILIHELIHIRRHDYLINLIQSMVEIILFFNPFVWLISTMIREERENCCDDQVIRCGSSRMDYAKALATLELSFSHPMPPLALALNKNKRQVLNRIKRIMETTVNNNRGNLRPLALITIIVLSFICISWLSFNPEKETDQKDYIIKPTKIIVVASDTTQNKKEKKESSENYSTATYSRKTITTFDEKGNPNEEVVEDFQGDEALRPLLEAPTQLSFTVPSLPSLPSIPKVSSLPAMPSFPSGMAFSYQFNGDSIPSHFFSPEERERWEDFGKDLAERFERFGKDNEEFGRMMEDWGNNFAKDFSLHFDENFHEKLDDLHEKLEDLEHNDEFRHQLDRGLKQMEEQLKQLDENLKEHNLNLKEIDKNMNAFQKELNTQLIKDGYLKKGEKVNSMNWGDGKLTINGIKIKDKDISKYEELSNRFFQGKKGFYFHD